MSTKKLPKLKLKRGSFSHTNGMGHDVYNAPYYDPEEVTAFKRAAKAEIKRLRTLVKDSPQREGGAE